YISNFEDELRIGFRFKEVAAQQMIAQFGIAFFILVNRLDGGGIQYELSTGYRITRKYYGTFFDLDGSCVAANGLGSYPLNFGTGQFIWYYYPFNVLYILCIRYFSLVRFWSILAGSCKQHGGNTA